MIVLGVLTRTKNQGKTGYHMNAKCSHLHISSKNYICADWESKIACFWNELHFCGRLLYILVKCIIYSYIETIKPLFQKRRWFESMNDKNNERKNERIDWPTFIGALILLLIVVVPLAIFPDEGEVIIDAAKDFLTGNFGMLYLIMGFGVFIFLLYVSFSRLGQIKLGEKDEQPEFGSFTWAAMLFAAGIGSSILYWGMIEWAFYYQDPPYGLESGTKEAIQWSSTYGIFHWGPIAWAIYTLPALPIAYFYYVRQKPVLKVSEACRPIIGRYADNWVGKVIDVLFMFGLLGGAGTTLALGTPLIAQGISELTGLAPNMWMKTIILLFTTVIFGISSYTGLRKGIKYLSDVNIWLALFLMAFVFVVGPTVFLSETALNSIGMMLDNFFHMSTWAEPFKNLGPFDKTGFPEEWTIFYWAWWLVYSPFVGLFIAKISAGRTVRQMALGATIYGSIGSFLFFGILGNYGLHLQLTGQLDVIDILNQQSPEVAIVSILNQLPLHTFIIVVFTILAVVFLATTFDSSSYILASVVQKEVDDEPIRWNRLFWALALSVMPLTLMYLGGLDTLKTTSIVGGVPLLIIMALLGISFYKVAKSDLGEIGRKKSPIYINERILERRMVNKKPDNRS